MCDLCVTLRGLHCIACVTASTSMVRLEVVTLWAPLSSLVNCYGVIVFVSQSFGNYI